MLSYPKRSIACFRKGITNVLRHAFCDRNVFEGPPSPNDMSWLKSRIMGSGMASGEPQIGPAVSQECTKEQEL